MIELRPLKKSHHIRSRSASRFFKAAAHASAHGRPLNLFVTINVSHTILPAASTSPAVAEICSKFTRWLSYQSEKAVDRGQPDCGRPTYEAVIEAPNGIHHIHWLVHVPDDLQDLFRRTVTKWVAKVCGEITKPDGAIHIEPVETVMALSRYLMKGVDPHHAKRCYVRPINQGVVFGKRIAISRSLGPMARAKDKVQSKTSPFLPVWPEITNGPKL
jgi:hypothetical protein